MATTETSSGKDAAKRSAMALIVFAVIVVGLVVLDPPNLYLWIKAAHVIAVISWMAGMLYLPRLFVYHTAAAAGSPQSETFKIMERKLYQLILTPAMIATWIFGLWLAWKGFDFMGGWLHAKIALVIVMSGIHGYLGGALRRFAEDRNTRTARHWRLVNEVPAVLIALIVVLVVVKPF